MQNHNNHSNNQNRYVVIMAGGVGSRFWPASREDMPKQFLDILGTGKSLIRLTFERFLSLVPAENIYVITHDKYKDLVSQHLPELSPGQIVGEPRRNNTAPAIAYMAFKLCALNPKATFTVAPSDHIILQEQAFLNTVKAGMEFANRNYALLTLGIQPTRPDTGYGYIQFEIDRMMMEREPVSIHPVIRFTEKPDFETAKKFLKSGNYVWNAGIFIWHVKAILAALKQNAPMIDDILCVQLEYYNTEKEEAYIREVFPSTPSISIDFAIMEKADNVYTIPSDFGWSDLGTWASLHAESIKDEKENAIQADHQLLDNVKNCMIRIPKDKLLVAKNLEDFIIIDEGDVLLIYPKSKEQEVRSIKEQIGKLGWEGYL